jgi:surface polysaccharide O-acyltransferase-like enzyme
MVVFLHSYNLDTKGLFQTLVINKNYNWIIQHFISFGITRIAVPLFFIISGFLFVYDSKTTLNELWTKVRKRIKTVLIPFLIWSLLAIIFYFILQQIPKAQLFFTNKLIINYTYTDFINTLVYRPIPYQLWFMRDLMILVVLSPIILFLIKKIKLIFLGIILVFWFLNYDSVFLTSEALLFFIIGILISKDYKQSIEQKIIAKGLPLMWLLVLILQVVFLFYDYKILAALFSKFSILIGVPSFWILYDFINKNVAFERNLKKITWATFFIYAFHEPFLTFIKKITFFLLGKSNLIILVNYFSAPLITILASVFFAYLLKHALPVFYSFLTGGR